MMSLTKKVAFVSTFIGSETYSILKKLLIPEDPDKKKYSDIVAILKKHFKPELNEIPERYKFHKEDQKSGQTIWTEYIVQLKSLAQTCNFKNFLNEALRDRFVFGLRDTQLRSQLLKQKKLTFDDAVEISLSWELAEKEKPNNNFAVIEYGAINQGCNRIILKSESPSRPSQSPSSYSNRCFRCGRYHNPASCPAVMWECFTCHRRGHTSRVCRSNQPRTSQSHQSRRYSPVPSTSTNSQYDRKKSNNYSVKEFSSDLEHLKLNKVDTTDDAVHNLQQSGSLCVKVIIEGQSLEMEVDSGACTSVISVVKYRELFSGLEIQNVNCNYFSVTGDRIQIVGKLMVNVKTQEDGREQPLELMVIKTTREVKPLLGRTWLDRLFPQWRIRVVNDKRVSQLSTEVDETVEMIKKEYPNVLPQSGGVIVGHTADIVMAANAKPIFHCCYTVPYHIKDAVGKELDRLVNERILSPV